MSRFATTLDLTSKTDLQRRENPDLRPSGCHRGHDVRPEPRPQPSPFFEDLESHILNDERSQRSSDEQSKYAQTSPRRDLKDRMSSLSQTPRRTPKSPYCNHCTDHVVESRQGPCTTTLLPRPRPTPRSSSVPRVTRRPVGCPVTGIPRGPPTPRTHVTSDPQPSLGGLERRTHKEGRKSAPVYPAVTSDHTRLAQSLGPGEMEPRPRSTVTSPRTGPNASSEQSRES